MKIYIYLENPIDLNLYLWISKISFVIYYCNHISRNDVYIFNKIFLLMVYLHHNLTFFQSTLFGKRKESCLPQRLYLPQSKIPSINEVMSCIRQVSSTDSNRIFPWTTWPACPAFETETIREVFLLGVFYTDILWMAYKNK